MAGYSGVRPPPTATGALPGRGRGPGRTAYLSGAQRWAQVTDAKTACSLVSVPRRRAAIGTNAVRVSDVDADGFAAGSAPSPLDSKKPLCRARRPPVAAGGAVDSAHPDGPTAR